MNQTKEQSGREQQTLSRVADNLYRSDQTGIYYALFKRNGKQIRRSLKTTDKDIARRRLAERREQVDQLDTSDAAKIAFAVFDTEGKLTGGLLRQYFDTQMGHMLPASRDTSQKDTNSFAKTFADQLVRNISLRTVETWADARRREIAPITFNRELGHLRRIFEYAVKHGIRLDNPADKKHIKRAKLRHVEIVPPTHEEFQLLVTEIRKTSDEAADFVAAMGYSGCRVSEIGGDKKYGYPPLCWQGDETNVNFKAGTFTVIGKGRKSRTPPLFPAFRELLLKQRAKLPTAPKPSDKVFSQEDPHASLKTACKNLGWHPKRFTNHDMRHFFASNAIELGIDFKVIAAWFGHSDGGILVAKTYGHLRQTHSMQMGHKMTFSVDQKPASNIVDVDMTASGTGNSADTKGEAVNQ